MNVLPKPESLEHTHSKSKEKRLTVVTGSYDGWIMLWNTEEKLWSVSTEVNQKYPINRLAISEDGAILAVAATDGVFVYRLEPDVKFLTRVEEKSNVTSIFFQLQPNLFYYTTEGGDLLCYDVAQQAKSLVFSNGVDINCAELSPNQSEVYFGDSYGNVKVIEVRQQTLKNSMCGNKNTSIRSLAISPICSLLAAGDSLGELYWWSLSEASVS